MATQMLQLKNISNAVRFEVFTVVTMKKAVFWDVALCRCGVNRCFGGTYRLHLQGRRKNKKIHKQRDRVNRYQQTAEDHIASIFSVLFLLP
jgi:hypothetical protein